MKKFLSILLAVLMLAATVTCASVVFADDTEEYTCTCTNCLKNADCKCCIYCPYTAKRLSCVKLHGGANGEAVYCCEGCTGMLGCKCGEDPELCNCEACKTINQTGEDPYSGQTQLIDSDTQKSIIKIFRSVLDKVAEVFDKLFSVVEEFLRLDDFFGRN